LFEKFRAGDASALDELTPALYHELHRIASRHLSRERPDHTLQATALVHEAYLKLFEGAERRFTDEVHFLAVTHFKIAGPCIFLHTGRSFFCGATPGVIHQNLTHHTRSDGKEVHLICKPSFGAFE
jgi:ECF sigma factor